MRASDLRQRLRAPLDPGGVRITDAVIEGALDLSAFELRVPLVFERCEFDSPPNLEGADLHSVAFVDCTLPGLLANGVRVRRDVDLTGSTVRGAHRTNASITHTAAVWLCESSIGGRLLFVRCSIDGLGDRALHADRIQVGGSVRFQDRFRSVGELRLIGAQVAGSVELYGAHLVSTRGPALNLASADIRGALFLQGLRGVTSVVATVIRGETSLLGSNLGALVVAGTAELSNPGGRALDLTNAVVRSQCRFESGLAVEGRIRLPRAHVHGRLLMRGVVLSQPEDGVLLDAYGLVVDGDVDLGDLTADGGRLVFNNLNCRRLDLTGARLTAPGGTALDLSSATVGGDIVLRGPFRSTGVVDLEGATAAGWLFCSGAVLSSLSAASATFAQGMDLDWGACDGVNLNGATTSTFVLRNDDWPAGAYLAGFTYDLLFRDAGELWDGRWISDWLERARFDAGAYEQAARVFRQHGYGAQAEYILIRGRDAASRLGLRNDLRGGSRGRRAVAPARWALDWLYGRAVGYGYRPGRALIALVLLLIAVLGLLSTPATEAFRASDARGEVYTVGRDCADGHVRCFNRVFYAVDTVVPLVSLNQRSTWYPDARARHGALVDALLNAATLLGWIFSTVVVLSFARLARTGSD